MLDTEQIVVEVVEAVEVVVPRVVVVVVGFVVVLDFAPSSGFDASPGVSAGEPRFLELGALEARLPSVVVEAVEVVAPPFAGVVVDAPSIGSDVVDVLVVVGPTQGRVVPEPFADEPAPAAPVAPGLPATPPAFVPATPPETVVADPPAAPGAEPGAVVVVDPVGGAVVAVAGPVGAAVVAVGEPGAPGAGPEGGAVVGGGGAGLITTSPGAMVCGSGPPTPQFGTARAPGMLSMALTDNCVTCCERGA